MSKLDKYTVLDIDTRKGSLLDKTGKHTITNTNVILGNSEKGMVGSYNGSTSVLTVTNVSDLNFSTAGGNDLPFSMKFWLKLNTIGDTATDIVGKTANLEYNISYNKFVGLVFRMHTNDTNFIGRSASTFLLRKDLMNHIVLTYSGNKISSGLKIYINGIKCDDVDANGGTYTGVTNTNDLKLMFYGNTRAKGLFGNFTIYNKELIQSEINSLYQDFLNSTPLLKPTSGWIKPKPTSLNENGLVAAYNMTIQKGKVYDISGNNNHGTAVNCWSAKDGVRFVNGKNPNISIATSITNDNIFQTGGTVCFEMEPITTGQNAAGVILFKGTSSAKGFGIYMVGASFGLTFYFSGGYYQWSPTGAALPLKKWICSITYDASAESNNPIIKVNNVIQTLTRVTSGTWNYASDAGTAMTIGNRPGLDLDFDGTINDIRIYKRILSDAETTKYYNSRINTVLLEKFENNGADGVSACPKEWRVGTTTTSIVEQLTHVNQSIKIGTKCLKFLGNGTVIKPIQLGSYTNNGYISYWFYNGSTWSERKGWINAPVTGVVYSNGLLTFTGSTNNLITAIKITDGIVV